MEDEVKDTISPQVRKTIYWVYFAVTLVVGSCQAYVAAIGAPQPEWITGALAVLAYAGAMLGLQAAVFTPKTPVSAVKPVDDGVATIEPVKEFHDFSQVPVEYSSGTLESPSMARVVDRSVIDPLNP